MQLRRQCSLAELMDQETCMVKQIRALDSDMQTLVYENYNKFISATGEGHTPRCYLPPPKFFRPMHIWIVNPHDLIFQTPFGR